MKYPFDLSYPPPKTISVLSFFALSMYDVILSKEVSSITAFTKLVKSSVGPTFIDFKSATIFSLKLFQSDLGIYARDAAEHFCPWNSNAPRTNAVLSTSTSAEECARINPCRLFHLQFSGMIY